MRPDFKQVLDAAKHYEKDICRFLREIVAIPSESRREGAVAKRVRAELEKVGFDRVEIDPMGNVLGYIGHGRRLVALDAHLDTVGTGDRSQWRFDPYEGYEDKEIIYGRGTSDQEGGMASMVYAGRIIKDLGLEGDYTLLCTGTVQEEDCDGLCWLYIVNEDGIRPEFVVSTEPTACNISLGQRGRVEIKVAVSGRSAHGAAPERGDNAIFKIAPILTELKELAGRLGDDAFLGKGSLTVSEICSTSPSRCAVADGCWISVDRRLTWGETVEAALQEIRALQAVKRADAEVSVYSYDAPSWTGLVYPTECFFPAWRLDANHVACQTLVETYKGLFDSEPKLGRWDFSTNGVAIMGRLGIPCIGFGPGHEDQAHAPNEVTWKDELVRAAAMYAAMPSVYTANAAR